MGSGLLDGRRIVIRAGNILTFMLVLVMSEMLTGLSRLVHAIRDRHAPGHLENEYDCKHVEEAFGHGADYNSLWPVVGTNWRNGGSIYQPQQPKTVENHQQTDTHIGEDGHPKSTGYSSM